MLHEVLANLTFQTKMWCQTWTEEKKNLEVHIYIYKIHFYPKMLILIHVTVRRKNGYNYLKMNFTLSQGVSQLINLCRYHLK